jgi:hypothetical protein
MHQILRAAFLAYICSSSTFAWAADPRPVRSFKNVSAHELVHSPDRYLNKRIKVSGVYCYLDGTLYRCTTKEPLNILSSRIVPKLTKRMIDEQCGGLDAIEEAPSCRLVIRFVPRTISSTIDKHVRDGRLVPARITMIRTGRVVATSDRP